MLGCSECILRIPNKLFNGPKTIRSVGYVDWDARWKDFSINRDMLYARDWDDWFSVSGKWPQSHNPHQPLHLFPINLVA